jgi:hypothetical protein
VWEWTALDCGPTRADNVFPTRVAPSGSHHPGSGLLRRRPSTKAWRFLDGGSVKAGYCRVDVGKDVEHVGKAGDAQDPRHLLAQAAEDHLSVVGSGPAGDGLQGDEPAAADIVDPALAHPFAQKATELAPTNGTLRSTDSGSSYSIPEIQAGGIRPLPWAKRAECQSGSPGHGHRAEEPR